MDFYTMKVFAIILAFGFACQVSDAFRIPDMKTCLAENGFTRDILDLERVEAIGDPDGVDRLKDVSNEKMAGVIACIYRKQYGDKDLKDDLQNFIQKDDKATEEEKKKMLETLTTCNTNAAGDNTKLLSCLNILAPPFDHVIGVMRDIPTTTAYGCAHKCGIKIREMLIIDNNKRSDKALLEFISEQKLGCFMGCLMDEDDKKRSRSQPTLFGDFTDLINRSKKHDENQKKEMLESLSKCNTQVAAADNKTHELIKCVNFFKPPFVDLY